jgi:hypothetical protein
MNKQNAYLYLPLVQALVDGKIIQTCYENEWLDMNEVEFESFDEPEDFRIKPEPRIWKIYVDPSGQIVDGYDYNYAKDQGLERITVQEVLE